jgi:hypothetical protein
MLLVWVLNKDAKTITHDPLIKNEEIKRNRKITISTHACAYDQNANL